MTSMGNYATRMSRECAQPRTTPPRLSILRTMGDRSACEHQPLDLRLSFQQFPAALDIGDGLADNFDRETVTEISSRLA